ncbi:MAG: hypothetical protein D6737_04630, partial [Chloroflexi bacterium]
EDLDLSYRAQLAGWRFLYLPDVVVPGEVPPQLAAYKQQQARWGQGSTQCLRKLIVPVWRGDFTLAQRIMATLHLSQYLPAPMLLLLLLLTPILLISGGFERFPSLAPLGVSGVGPPLMYAIAQAKLYPDWKRRMLVFPLVTILGTGIAWNNTRAVLAALRSNSGEFKRTPKFSRRWQSSRYAMRGDASLWIEAGFALYALWGMLMAARHAPLLIPYMGTFFAAFAGIVVWQVADRWQMRRYALRDMRPKHYGIMKLLLGALKRVM